MKTPNFEGFFIWRIKIFWLCVWKRSCNWSRVKSDEKSSKTSQCQNEVKMYLDSTFSLPDKEKLDINIIWSTVGVSISWLTRVKVMWELCVGWTKDVIADRCNWLGYKNYRQHEFLRFQLLYNDKFPALIVSFCFNSSFVVDKKCSHIAGTKQ